MMEVDCRCRACSQGPAHVTSFLIGDGRIAAPVTDRELLPLTVLLHDDKLDGGASVVSLYEVTSPPRGIRRVWAGTHPPLVLRGSLAALSPSRAESVSWDMPSPDLMLETGCQSTLSVISEESCGVT